MELQLIVGLCLTSFLALVVEAQGAPQSDLPASPLGSWHLQKGEMVLAFGLTVLVLTLALTHFVMGIFLALIPGMVALVLLGSALVRMRDPSQKPAMRATGMLLLFFGICVIVIAGFKAAGMSYRDAFHSSHPNSPPPGLIDWGKTVAASLIAILIIEPGLRHWTNWAPRRRLFWCIIAFLIPAAVFVTHQTLVANGWSISS